MEVPKLGPLVSGNMIRTRGASTGRTRLVNRRGIRWDGLSYIEGFHREQNKNGLVKRHGSVSPWQHETLPIEGSVFYQTSVYKTVSAYMLYVLSQEPKKWFDPVHSYAS